MRCLVWWQQPSMLCCFACWLIYTAQTTVFPPLACHRTRSSTATVSNASGGMGSASCHVLRITRDALGRMAQEAPGALHVLQVGLVSVLLSPAVVMEAV